MIADIMIFSLYTGCGLPSRYAGAVSRDIADIISLRIGGKTVYTADSTITEALLLDRGSFRADSEE